ncbi:DNA-binding protein [Nocardia arizonensis]|uniref:DNA-binding protein n=1 Tax=Nocardia arizonensis TaxID=1141647 RepID=UPI0006D15D2A|nr:DNA-binding protein [Nocardia arizonensis]
MKLSDLEVRATLYALDELVRARTLRGAGIPEAVRHLYARMQFAAQYGEPDEEPVTDTAEISSAEAAEILGYSKRYVCMIAADLDGRRVGRRLWVFSRATVQAYAEARRIA